MAMQHPTEPSVSPFFKVTITQLHTWVPGKLFSFQSTRPVSYRFTAGQFARLGVTNTLLIPSQPEIIFRAYSMVSGPYDPYLEFFSIVVPDGAFTQHLSQIKVGDDIWLDPTAHGFLTTARFETGKDLVLLASGTGLAPFISILYDLCTWEQFEHVCLVHSVRTLEELVYGDALQGFTTHPVWAEAIPNLAQRFSYIPTITRQALPGVLNARITDLIANNTIASITQRPWTEAHTRFMICGNPEMVTDVRNTLKKIGFLPARRSTPGHIAVENYW